MKIGCCCITTTTTTTASFASSFFSVMAMMIIMIMMNHPHPSDAQLCGQKCFVIDICRRNSGHINSCTMAHECCEWIGDNHHHNNSSSSIGCQARSYCKYVELPCPCHLVCPKVIRGGGVGGPCYDKCNANRDCVGGNKPQICCRNECGGHECMDGVPSDRVCPRINNNDRSSSSSSCRDDCNSNEDCRNGQICCLTGRCTFKCLYGVPVPP